MKRYFIEAYKGGVFYGYAGFNTQNGVRYMTIWDRPSMAYFFTDEAEATRHVKLFQDDFNTHKEDHELVTCFLMCDDR